MNTFDFGTAFTYEAVEDTERDLRQGDIIQPNPEVRNIINEVHPHFADEKYIAFLVLTQTCDLVRRDPNPCKSRYINLAVVRLLKDVIHPLLERVCGRIELGKKHVQGFYYQELQNSAFQLLERIFNQNAQSEGIFYLHPDASVKIEEPSVALLQVSVALKAHEHYGQLIGARSGGLAEPFQSKLGWLIGNLFSRVATKDWEKPIKNKMIKAFLEKSKYTGDTYPRWVPKKHVRAAEEAMIDITGKNQNEIADCISECKPVAPKDTAIECVLSHIKEVVDDISDEKIESLKKRLASDVVFDAACKQ